MKKEIVESMVGSTAGGMEEGSVDKTADNMAGQKSALQENLPKEVKECRFCCWRRAFRNGKVTKVPYGPKTGGRAKVDRPGTFGTFDEALSVMGKYHGIGILVGNGIAAFDIDQCIGEDGGLNALAASVLGKLKNCYVEVSPSGTGLRGFFKVPDGYSYDRNAYYIKHGSLEIYIPGMTNRFVTVTGDVYRAGDVPECTDGLQAVLEEHMKRKGASASLPDGFEPHSYLDDMTVLEKARRDKKFSGCFDGGWAEYFPSQSEADLYVMGVLAFYCGGDMEQMGRIFSGSALMRDKFSNRDGLTAYAERTMKMAVAGRERFYEPGYGRTLAAEDFAGGYGPDRDIADDRHGGDGGRDSGDGGDGGKSERDGAGKLDGELDAFLKSEPTISDLYSRDNILLAAYAKAMRPADYETIRTFARKNGMGLKRYEQEIKAEEGKVRNRLEARKGQERIKAAEKASGKEMPGFVYYNPRTDSMAVNPAKLAIHVRENLRFILVQDSLRDTRTKYVYEGGVYSVCSDERFRGFIKCFIEDFDPTLVRMKDVDEAYRNVSTGLVAVPFDRLNADENIINFRNGLLHLDTMELGPHDPAVLSTVQLDCDWAGHESPTPVFDGYLATLADFSVPVQNLLLEFMGAVLSNIRGARYKKALFLCGAGDTGKSQLKALTERLLGRDNFAAIDLPELENQFGSSMIYGKRLAGTADMTFLTLRELKTFKTVTGGDNIKIEFKGRTGFSYVYNGFLWFCMNQKPKFGGDDGEWVYNRIMLVECPNVIPPEKQDHGLLDKMFAERDGIAYKAIMALKGTVKNGYRFTEPVDVVDARDEYRYENNSVIQFIQDCMAEREKPGCIPAGDNTTVSSVHRIYLKWCKYNNNGYYKTLKEFKKAYAEYTGLPFEKTVVRRGKGMYLVNHEVTEEAFVNLLPSDADIHRDFVFGGI